MATPVLGERKTVRRGKSLRNCILGLCDEFCIYHREKDIYDHLLKVGLPILKVQPVESKQPRLHCKQSLQSMAGLAFTRHISLRDVGGPSRLPRKECKRDLLEQIT